MAKGCKLIWQVREVMEKMTEVKLSGTVIDRFSLSFISDDNIVIGKTIVKNDDGYFPVVCFSNLAKIMSRMVKEQDELNITGILKDYIYTDFNETPHVVKILLITKTTVNGRGIYTTFNGSKDTVNADLNSMWQKLIRKNADVFDVVRYEIVNRIRQAESEAEYAFSKNK